MKKQFLTEKFHRIDRSKPRSPKNHALDSGETDSVSIIKNGMWLQRTVRREPDDDAHDRRSACQCQINKLYNFLILYICKRNHFF
jgi:hypothetical protein